MKYLMFIRIIIPEIAKGSRIPTTQYPSLDSPLPSDLPPSHRFDSPFLRAEAVSPPLLNKVHGCDIGYFARHAQSVYLLNRFFDITNHVREQEEQYGELRKLDADVQDFLSLLMNEDRWTVRFGCGAIANSVRFGTIKIVSWQGTNAFLGFSSSCTTTYSAV